MSCYLCNDPNFTIRKGVVRDALSLEILECVGCGLLTLSFLKHIQAGHYEDSGMHGNTLPAIDSWLRGTEEDDQCRFTMLQARLVSSGVLEFGCGAAGFLRRAQVVAAEVAGVEPERRVHEYWGDSIALHARLEDAGVRIRPVLCLPRRRARAPC